MLQQKDYLKTTKLITAHYGEEYEHYYNAIVPPVFMNSLNVFETIDEYYNFERTAKHKYCYGRVQNPTVRILEDKVGALEHGIGALAFSSGMAAAVTAVLTACKVGSHVICIRNAYGPLKTFLNGYAKEHMGLTTTYLTGEDVAEFEANISDQTDLVILESPSSLVFTLQDIESVAAIAKKHQALLYIDNTYCTPLYQQPLDLGADIVMHTTSKYIGGHSDLIGGMLTAKDPGLFNKLLENRELMGGIVGPMEAWLMIRGLRTLELRLKQHEDTAMKVAHFLESHPKIRKVYYPGLKSHPQYELMKKQQTGNCGLLSFEIEGTEKQAEKVAESLKYFKIGVSWGGFESLVFMPHARLGKEESRKLGVDDNIIRIHCGLEGDQMLIDDLASALTQI